MTFSQEVLQLTAKIPRGKLTTYKEIAKKLHTKAYRAVGAALRNNSKPMIIPCHRVVNTDGSLGGYMGIKNNPEKIRLLKKEGIDIKSNTIDLKKYLFTFR